MGHAIPQWSEYIIQDDTTGKMRATDYAIIEPNIKVDMWGHIIHNSCGRGLSHQIYGWLLWDWLIIHEKVSDG